MPSPIRPPPGGAARALPGRVERAARRLLGREPVRRCGRDRAAGRRVQQLGRPPVRDARARRSRWTGPCTRSSAGSCSRTSPRQRVAGLEPRVRAYAVEMLEPLIDAAGGDLAPALTYPLPARVLVCVARSARHRVGLSEEASPMSSSRRRRGAATTRRRAHVATRSSTPTAAGSCTSALSSAAIRTST